VRPAEEIVYPIPVPDGKIVPIEGYESDEMTIQTQEEWSDNDLFVVQRSDDNVQAKGSCSGENWVEVATKVSCSGIPGEGVGQTRRQKGTAGRGLSWPRRGTLPVAAKICRLAQE